MMIKKSLLFAFLLLGTTLLNAQFTRYTAPVFFGNDRLIHGLAGGLIAPQFSEVDLNNDGIKDLFIFDRAGNVSLTFLNNGTANEVDYVYAPFYERFFPDMIGWVLLRDYDGDGIEDIFTFSDFPGIDGVIVYKGLYQGNAINFERFNFTHILPSNTIPFPAGGGFTQLYVSEQDYPAVDDIDGDGDLDIVTFAVGGGNVYWYENQSVELGHNRDSLIFLLEDNCWGRFYESGISEAIDLSDDIGMCSNGFRDTEISIGLRHAGSTLLTFDNDADGDKEVLLGDVSFTNLNLVVNGGDADMAFMTSQDTFFPSYDVPTDMQIFPASFYVDVNNDGIKDLLASPNDWKTGENYDVVWHYENNGANNAPVFDYKEKDFLVDEMLDMGKETYPSFVDYNADGLLDLVVGNGTFYLPFGERATRLYLFENTGTANSPRFTLVDEDYLNFSNFDATATNGPAPCFGDLDNDGDMDVLIGEAGGSFYYGENTAGAGNPINIPVLQFDYMDLDLGARTVPQLIDLNRDGKLDIVAGVKRGSIVYLQNEGTPESPLFIPNVSNDSAAGNNNIFLGGVDVRLGEFSGYSAPFVYDFGSDFGLFTGSNVGDIQRHSNIAGNLDGIFTLVDDFFSGHRSGFHTTPVLVDIDNNGVLEMFVGNTRGGLVAYRTNVMTNGQTVSNEEVSSPTKLDVYPNPTNGLLNIRMENLAFPAVPFRVFNSIGLQVYQGEMTNDQIAISTDSWGKGLFVIQFKIGEERLVKKVIVQ